MTSKAVFATTQRTQSQSAVFVIGSKLLWHYYTIIRCVMATCSYGIYFWWTGANRLYPSAA